MLYKLSLGAALVIGLTYSSMASAQPTQPPEQYFAPGVYSGHHVCGANKKMGHCPMAHHYMGHHLRGASKKSGY